MSIINNLVETASKEFATQFDDIFKEGLSKKGINIGSDEEFINFIKLNVICVDNTAEKTRTYLINNEPFLLHKYEPSFNQKIVNDSIIMDVNYGSYQYL